MDLQTLPKVELHRHLEGSIRLETAFELARIAELPLPARTPAELSRHLQVLEPMESLTQVLRVFDFIARLFTSEAVVERLAQEVIADAALDSIRLLELRFSPDYMARPAGLSWDRLTEAILRGVERARQEHDIVVGLIAIVSRNLGVESAARTVDYARRWRTALVGFDLADDEASWPSHLFRDALRPIQELGLGLTVHSGEATGPSYVIDTLDALAPRRLGHGVAMAKDEALIDRVVREGVAIEACPTSNLRTRAVASLETHPAKALLDRGVCVTLNTDDPGLFDLTLSGELEVARTRMGFTDKDLVQVQRNALRASFVPESVKAEVAARWLDRGDAGWAERDPSAA